MSSTMVPTSVTSSDSGPIVVIGAGVLGLSTANLLQSRFPKRQITLLAEELPSPTAKYTATYASPWAGAHYRPIHPSTPQLQVEFELAQRTFEVMKEIARETPEAGVELMQGVEYFDRPPQGERSMKDGDVYAGPGDGFRVLRDDELIGDATWGCEYQTYCINVLVYCSFLLRKFESRGGRVVKRRVGSAKEAFLLNGDGVGKEVRTVVNCSGTNFGQDPKTKMIRGQTCLVRNPYHRTLTRQYADGRWATVIPRPCDGGTIVGVSKEIGDEEVEARLETRQLLLEQSIECFPDFVKKLQDFDVVDDIVGRRPFREGGLRMDVEQVGGHDFVVHGYGAGGRGYELSWGVAQRLVALVDSCQVSQTARGTRQWSWRSRI